MIWATVSSQSCFCWLYRFSSIFGCKEYNQSDFGIDHLVMSVCRIFSCVVGRRCLLRPVPSLDKTLLTFALLHFVLQSQTCLLARYLFTSYFCISIPIMKGHLFWGVNSRKSCRSLYNCSTSASSALVVGTQTWITVIWIVCLVNKLRSFCHFWDCTQVLHFGLFCWLWGLPHFLQGIVAQSSRYNGHVN